MAVLVEQRFEQAIVGPEVMPPFADAMRLVDRDQRKIDPVDQAAERELEEIIE